MGEKVYSLKVGGPCAALDSAILCPADILKGLTSPILLSNIWAGWPLLKVSLMSL